MRAFFSYRFLPIIALVGLAFFISACSSSPDASIIDYDQIKKMSEKSSKGEIIIEENNKNLGDVSMQKGKVSTQYRFTNIGDEPVVLMQGVSSCMCTVGRIEKDGKIISPVIQMPGHGAGTAKLMILVQPKESLALRTVFDPNAHGPSATGPIMREILISTNSVNTPEVSFTFSGNVVP